MATTVGPAEQRRRSRIKTIGLAAAGLAACVAGVLLALYLLRFELLRRRLDLPAYTHRAGLVLESRVPMRDGVRLMTRTHLPKGAGPWPAVLIRNPYDARGFLESMCEIYARFGYACVYQQVRGRMDSEGEWAPLVHERSDGLDTLAWLTNQRWQDGHLAMYGPSYLGMVQWTVADAVPPEVKTLVPMFAATDQYDVFYQDGMLRHEIVTAWAALMGPNGLRTDHGPLYRQALVHRPHIEADERFFGGRQEWYRDTVLSQGRGDALWNREDALQLRRVPEAARVPVLTFGGWHDIFLRPQLDDVRRLRTRADSVYVIGPWTHLQRPAGDYEYADPRGSGEQWRTVLAWFDHHLRGAPLELPRGTVKTYAIGEGRWHVREAWPPPTEPLRFYLRDADRAAGCDGGRLVPVPVDAASVASYTYHPDDPAPTRGGTHSLAFILPGFSDSRVGPVHQDGLCSRADVLSFLSAPLEEDMHIAGGPRVRLTVSSDAADTAFTAKLIEVRPDGSTYNIRDSITSLAYRNGALSPQSYEPGVPVAVTIDCWPIEWRVPAGSRLRLDVSSSNFPMYHAHVNLAGPWAEQRYAVPARQTVYVGGDHQAYLELPLWRGAT